MSSLAVDLSVPFFDTIDRTVLRNPYGFVTIRYHLALPRGQQFKVSNAVPTVRPN